MLKNYLTMALRLISGHRLYAAINVLGLGIGLACCLLILLYVRHELSYERGFADTRNIYRISREYYATEGARARVPATNNAPVAPALMADFPAIELAGRIVGGGTLLATDTLSVSEPAVRFVDPEILKIFSFDWIAGDPDSALATPTSIVLTETLARKYFGTTAALGQRLRMLDLADVTVTGVIRDLPATTHLNLSGLIPLSAVIAIRGPSMVENWNRLTDFHTYFRLRDGADVADIVAAMPAFLSRHAGGDIVSELSAMHIMNIEDIHLRSDRDEEWKPHGSISAVWSFALIAVGILVIACINFMSIATARSGQRAKEVGMRKTFGASRGELIGQFLGESVLTALAALLLAIMLAEMLLPTFSRFFDMELAFAWSTDPGILLAVAGLALFAALFAGSYPAFFLSNFNTAKVLKGEVTRGRRGLGFRNALVVFQFSIAITLLISTVVVYKQRELATSMDLGFNKDEVVVLRSSAPTGFQQDWMLLKERLMSNPAIESVTASHFLPFGFNDNQFPVSRAGSAISSRMQYMLVDFDFFETFAMDIVAGRTFTPELGVDAGSTPAAAAEEEISLIINESGARALGLDVLESIGARLAVEGAFEGTLVGIVNDTYFESIHNAVRPLLFILAPPQIPNGVQLFRSAAIRIRANAQPEALAHIDATWNELYPDQLLNRGFLDENFQAMYQAEAKQGQLFSWFSTIAIVIACFGLFGLASFNAERRTKEIGVRKVMGGSVLSIVVLLTNEFSRLVLLANLIAWPVAYIVMNRWLENFAYRIDLTPLVFIGSGLIALCIAWVTVGGTAAKAASTKPVLALRYE